MIRAMNANDSCDSNCWEHSTSIPAYVAMEFKSGFAIIGHIVHSQLSI